MRGLVSRFNHRDAVLGHLNALLLMYPRGRQLTDDFPELKTAIRAHFEEGVAAPSSALQIAASMLGNFLRQLDEREKVTVLDALVKVGRQGFADIAARRVGGERDGPRDRVRFVTRLAGVAAYMAARMTEEGTLRPDDHAAFLAALESMLGADAARERTLSRSFALQKLRSR